MPEDRRLAAIMFTDIVGYTALMGRDEDKAFKILRKNRGIQRPIIKKYRGEWLKEMGDGVLASFNTSSDAVRCAGEIQQAAKKEGIGLRIGIHEGEVVFEGGDVLGDGVNVASRLEELAQEGCINISGAVYKDIKNKAGITTEYLEEKELKNVEDPVKVYKVHFEDGDQEQIEEKDAKASKSMLPNYIFAGIIIVLITIIVWQFLPPKDTMLIDEKFETAELDRSIAVLPFADMSPNQDQGYFSDGIMDEILMHLFKIGDLKVTSRTSVMQFKGTSKTIPEIAKELGVAHVLEGSVRKEGERIRIVVQLIDAINDTHMWAESYDREKKDVFAIQSEIATEVAKALQAEINPEAQRIINSMPTNNPEAYDLYLKASAMSNYNDKENSEAITLYEKVLELDPNFGLAYRAIGLRLTVGATFLSSSKGMDPREAWQIAEPYYKKALEINPDDGVAHRVYAWSLLWYEWNFQSAEIEYLETQRIFPNYSWTDYHLSLGQFEEAYRGAMLNVEVDSRNSNSWQGIITSAYFAGRDPEGEIKNALILPIIKDNVWVISECARVNMYLKKYDQAIFLSEQLHKNFPEINSPRMTCIEAISYFNTNRPDRTNKIVEELRKRSEVNAGGSPSFYLAMIYTQIGEIDLAFEWLEKAYTDHEVEMYWLKVEPPFKPLHDDPRWQVMLDKVGFTD